MISCLCIQMKRRLNILGKSGYPILLPPLSSPFPLPLLSTLPPPFLTPLAPNVCRLYTTLSAIWEFTNFLNFAWPYTQVWFEYLILKLSCDRITKVYYLKAEFCLRAFTGWHFSRENKRWNQISNNAKQSNCRQNPNEQNVIINFKNRVAVGSCHSAYRTGNHCAVRPNLRECSGHFR